MKYTEKELKRLKTVKDTTKTTYRVFIDSEDAESDTYRVQRRALKDNKSLAKHAYYSYKKKYKKYCSTKHKIKMLRKEMKKNEKRIDSEDDIKQTCLDNIVVETRHSSYDDFVLKAVAAYTREQPVRFDTVAPYILAYEHSTKLLEIHKTCIRIANKKLDILNIELASI